MRSRLLAVKARLKVVESEGHERDPTWRTFEEVEAIAERVARFMHVGHANEVPARGDGTCAT